MISHYVYILQSTIDTDRYYIGYSTNPDARLIDHNNGQSKHTTKYKPWKLINVFGFEDKSKAIEFEGYLKSHSGRAFCKKHF